MYRCRWYISKIDMKTKYRKFLAFLDFVFKSSLELNQQCWGQQNSKTDNLPEGPSCSLLLNQGESINLQQTTLYVELGQALVWNNETRACEHGLTFDPASPLPNKNKRAMRPWLAHLSKQAKSETHHLSKPDCLKLSNYDRHWLLVKGQRMILTYIAKNVHILIYLNFAINSSTSSINSSHMKAWKANLILP